MDDVVISNYCIGYYWQYAFVQQGPYANGKVNVPRSPAVVYRPSIPNPALTFNIMCPDQSYGVRVGSGSMSDVSLVPRCGCQEEDQFQSLQSQPRNAALNGNFADYDLTQENPVSGWISQESWRGQVIPVQYNGKWPADDPSNKGAV
jgi:hypothetical protein